MRNLNKRLYCSLSADLSLSPDVLASYLPLKSSGRGGGVHKREEERKFINVLCRFWSEANRHQKGELNSRVIAFPDDYDEDWRWLLLLSAQVCFCHYSLKKASVPEGEDNNTDHKFNVYLSGAGAQPELCQTLLVFLWPRFRQLRRRGWHHYVHFLRKIAGTDIQMAAVVRENWRREFCIQWVLTVWNDTQVQYAIDTASEEEMK